jgi:hypothetical protein
MSNLIELATQLEIEPDQIEAFCSIFGLTWDGEGNINNHSSKLNHPLQIESLLPRLVEQSKTSGIPLEVLAQQILGELQAMAAAKSANQTETKAPDKFELDTYFQARYGQHPSELPVGSLQHFMYELLNSTFKPLSEQMTAMGLDYVARQVHANLRQGWEPSELMGKSAVNNALELLKEQSVTLINWEEPPALSGSTSKALAPKSPDD